MENKCQDEDFARRFRGRLAEGYPRQKKWIKAIETKPVLYMKPSGHWYVPCNVETLDSDGLTELDEVWNAVGELVKEKVFIQAAYQRSSFPVVSGSTVYTTVVVNCYVENYLDIQNVLHSATEFRKKVYYPYPLFLKTTSELFPGKLETLVQYLYCLDGDLYQFVPGRSFQLVKRNTSI